MLCTRWKLSQVLYFFLQKDYNVSGKIGYFSVLIILEMQSFKEYSRIFHDKRNFRKESKENQISKPKNAWLARDRFHDFRQLVIEFAEAHIFRMVQIYPLFFISCIPINIHLSSQYYSFMLVNALSLLQFLVAYARVEHLRTLYFSEVASSVFLISSNFYYFYIFSLIHIVKQHYPFHFRHIC